jgi:hypothetical protein
MRDESSDDENEIESTPAEKEPEPDVLCFKTVRKEKKVCIEDEDGKKTNMLLREMTGTEKGKYMASMGNRAKFDQKGNPIGLRNYDGLEASLISKCLYDVATGKLVDEKVINGWPISVQQGLMKACVKMNAMDDDSREKEKNS